MPLQEHELNGLSQGTFPFGAQLKKHQEWGEQERESTEEGGGGFLLSSSLS